MQETLTPPPSHTHAYLCIVATLTLSMWGSVLTPSRTRCHPQTYCRLSCKLCDPAQWQPRRQFIAPWQQRFMKTAQTVRLHGKH